MKKGIRFLLYTLCIAFPVLLFFSARWFFATWSKVTVSEVIFHLATSLKGTSHSMLRQYALSCALPALLVLAVLLFVSFHTALSGKKTRRIIMALMAALFFFDIAYLFNGLDAGEYIRAQMDRSVFVEQQYVDPKDVALSFPEKKRNLIYIYLESMETTFADPENGGAFPKNVIPELTELAQENEDFSGDGAALEGGYSMPGTDWTMGGMFAQTSGLPLLIPIDINAMSTQSVFFPGIVTLGDILHDNGYRQVLLLGSDAVFGGREVYFTSHGGYEMVDYPYAIEQGWIPESYNVWWGYEDEKLFAFAKKMLLELSASDEPFNLTFLTTDTHFEDGYICRLCGDEFGDNQYANAYACSSRQVTEFVRWVQEQDFYEDTTIVLCGDHPTMDADFCQDVDGDYVRRTYTCYINSASTCADPARRRTFTTFDDFPTTLAAMGVTIPGERLGLGTNLFSGEPTLSETYGTQYMESEISKRSDFVNALSHIDLQSEALLEEQALESQPGADTVVEVDEGASITLTVSGIRNMIEQVRKVEAEYYRDGDVSTKRTVPLKESQGGVYTLDIPWEEIDPEDEDINVYVTGALGSRYQVFGQNGDVRVKEEVLTDYLKHLDDILSADEAGRYTVLTAVRKNITSKLTQEEALALSGLGGGIKTLFSRSENISFCAEITRDAVRESAGEEAVTQSGTVPAPDGPVQYVLESDWRGGLHSIRIGDREYMLEKQGIYFVLWDGARGKAADAVGFDLINGETVRRLYY